MLKRRFLACVLLLISVAMVLPTTALATYNWRKSPVSPLIVGGVHSTGGFKHVLLNHRRVQLAMKGVLRADRAPSWVYGAAIAQVRAGAIRSTSLPRGTALGAMAFGPRTTKIVKNTVWRGTGRLPYFYVNATQSVVQDGVRIDTTYQVALAKTCGNPFVLGPTVTRTPIVQPTYNLYIQKRERGSETLLGDWMIYGTVGGVQSNTYTSAQGPVLVGSYPAGTVYDLQERIPDDSNWFIASPAGGIHNGVMPAQDLTLEWVNYLD